MRSRSQPNLRNSRVLTAMSLLAALAVVGCSESSSPVDTLPRVAVSGTVTLGGAPLPEGTIELDPADGTKGPPAAAEITDGKFSIDKAQGPVPGKYKVSISSHPPAKLAEGEAPGGSPKPTTETVPAKYNTATTLETDVPAGGTATLAFPLDKS